MRNPLERPARSGQNHARKNGLEGTRPLSSIRVHDEKGKTEVFPKKIFMCFFLTPAALPHELDEGVVVGENVATSGPGIASRARPAHWRDALVLRLLCLLVSGIACRLRLAGDFQ